MSRTVLPAATFSPRGRGILCWSLLKSNCRTAALPHCLGGLRPPLATEQAWCQTSDFDHDFELTGGLVFVNLGNPAQPSGFDLEGLGGRAVDGPVEAVADIG